MDVHTPVLRFIASTDHDLDPSAWPMTVPAVVRVMAEGFEPAGGVTLLVGENGAGKSTIVEAFAEAYGLSPEGGTPFGGRQTRRSESSLARALRLHRGAAASRYGFFLRAETMHGWFTYVEGARQHQGSALPRDEPRRVVPGGAAIPHRQRRLLLPRRTRGRTVVHQPAGTDGGVARPRCRRRPDRMRTHSPILAALPGARILECGPWGMRDTRWEDLELVAHWQGFLDAPARYLRHLLS